MATKPTETLTFEPPDASVVAIPSAKQAAGFLPGERPPAQYLSWLFRTLSRLYNYVKDGQFTGNHSIAGALTTTGAIDVTGSTVRFPATPSPASVWRDSANRARFMVDRFGLPSGQISSYSQPWIGATLPSDWAATLSTGSPSATVLGPSSATPWRTLALTVPASSEMALAGPTVVYLDNNAAITMDCGVYLTFTGTPPEFFVGLTASGGDFVGVNGYGNNTVAAYWSDSPGSSTIMTGAWVAGGLNHVKIEVEGSNVSGLSAGTFRLRTYVNGVTSTPLTFTTSPAATAVAPFFSCGAISGSSGVFRVGGIRTQWISVLPNQY